MILHTLSVPAKNRQEQESSLGISDESEVLNKVLHNLLKCFKQKPKHNCPEIVTLKFSQN